MPPKMLDQLVIPIPGSCALKEIKNVIRFHEASLWKLSDIALNGRINMATFVPADDVPNDLEFVANTAQAPANSTLVWKGTLRYNSAEQTIALYRAN